ncbi:extracellular solute-binding protein [Cohnella cellulosilytica]|uniref:Extracellular solute-binding protein n=1 Tax=Cohnella cellulosilytica TaxID=986710 RepID=A0ABW2FJK4_9BACL
MVALWVKHRLNQSYGTYEEYLLQDPFISGKTAMSIDGNSLIAMIKEAQTVLGDKAVKNWDVVTMPVDPQNPNVTDTTSVDQILAIDAQSPNVEAAWTFLQYVNGDEFARVSSKRNSGSFPVRTSYIADEENHNLQAFYVLAPVEETVFKDYGEMPNEIFGEIMNAISAELSEAELGNRTVAEAMNRIQDRGQLLLDGKGERPEESAE